MEVRTVVYRLVISVCVTRPHFDTIRLGAEIRLFLILSVVLDNLLAHEENITPVYGTHHLVESARL